MGQLYYLFSVRFNGWHSRTGSITSEIKDAKTFTRDEALDLCKSLSPDGKPIHVPVEVNIMNEIAS